MFDSEILIETKQIIRCSAMISYILLQALVSEVLRKPKSSHPLDHLRPHLQVNVLLDLFQLLYLLSRVLRLLDRELALLIIRRRRVLISELVVHAVVEIHIIHLLILTVYLPYPISKPNRSVFVLNLLITPVNILTLLYQVVLMGVKRTEHV